MNSAEQVLKEIEALAYKKHPDMFLPIVGPEKGKLLEDLIKNYKPKKILEIGTLVGYSAILMAQHGPNVISLEVDPKAAEIAKQNIEKAGLSDKVEIIVGDAKKTIEQLKDKFDMIFIDAKKDECIDYLKLSEKNMKSSTIVVADNVKKFAEEVKDYLDRVRNSGLYESKYHDFGFDAVEVSVRK